MIQGITASLFGCFLVEIMDTAGALVQSALRFHRQVSVELVV